MPLLLFVLLAAVGPFGEAADEQLGRTVTAADGEAEGESEAEADAETEANECGLRSVALLMKLSGTDRGYHHLKAFARENSIAGYSIDELQRVSAACDFPLVSEHFDSTQLLRYGPMVTLFKSTQDGHFVVVRPITSNLVQLLDPPFVPKVLPITELSQSPSWTGMLLRPMSWRERVFDTYKNNRTWIYIALAGVAIILRRTTSAGTRSAAVA